MSVSWKEATNYANWLSDKTGQKLSLPTEAQWEYAARGGSQSARYWGEGANAADNTAKSQWNGWTIHDCQDACAVASPIGKFQPNDFGLYDMLGNVWEWTCSVYSKSYDGAENRCSDSSNTARRIFRGGGWYANPGFVRSAYRGIRPAFTSAAWAFVFSGNKPLHFYPFTLTVIASLTRACCRPKRQAKAQGRVSHYFPSTAPVHWP